MVMIALFHSVSEILHVTHGRTENAYHYYSSLANRLWTGKESAEEPVTEMCLSAGP